MAYTFKLFIFILFVSFLQEADGEEVSALDDGANGVGREKRISMVRTQPVGRHPDPDGRDFHRQVSTSFALHNSSNQRHELSGAWAKRRDCQLAPRQKFVLFLKIKIV